MSRGVFVCVTGFSLKADSSDSNYQIGIEELSECWCVWVCLFRLSRRATELTVPFAFCECSVQPMPPWPIGSTRVFRRDDCGGEAEAKFLSTVSRFTHLPACLPTAESLLVHLPSSLQILRCCENLGLHLWTIWTLHCQQTLDMPEGTGRKGRTSLFVRTLCKSSSCRCSCATRAEWFTRCRQSVVL